MKEWDGNKWCNVKLKDGWNIYDALCQWSMEHRDATPNIMIKGKVKLPKSDSHKGLVVISNTNGNRRTRKILIQQLFTEL